jgi:hypothetical protein
MQLFYIVPELLGVVDILVFLVPLRLFILVLPPVRPFMLPLCMVPLCMRSVPVWLGVVMVPFCMVLPLVVPFCIVPLVLPLVLPFCIVPLVLPLCIVPAGVVWAKAVVLRQRAQAAATRILVAFMTSRIRNGWKRKSWLPTSLEAPAIRQKAQVMLPEKAIIF